MEDRRANQAFTLIEILIVIAIIGLLVGILVPALSSARQTAKKVVCGTHLRQLGVATELYYNENNCIRRTSGSCPMGRTTAGHPPWRSSCAPKS